MNNNIIIIHASELVTCSGFKAKSGAEMSNLGIIEDGALIIENGKILALGRTDEVDRKQKQESLEREYR